MQQRPYEKILYQSCAFFDCDGSASEKERLRQEFESEGRRLPPKLDSQVFDSNVMNSWNGVHVYSFICVAILHSR